MDINNIKEILDAGFKITNNKYNSKPIVIEKMYDGTYRFFKLNSLDGNDNVIIETKNWNEFAMLVKKEMENK